MFSKKWLKITAIYLGLALILVLFALYVHGHPSVIDELKHLKLWLLLVLLFGYGLVLLALMGINNAILSFCAKPLKNKENMLLTIYSTLSNFFMPLQSGIGVRSAYVKSKHKVPVFAYIKSSLIYFTIYSLISCVMIFATGHYFWFILPGIAFVSLISYAVIKFANKRFSKKHKAVELDISRTKLSRLILFTLGYVLIQSAIYFIELYQVSGNLNPLRAISYTGAADFSIFVSLTPGAIGFREAFLALSKRMHGFSNSQILAANIIDRGVFLVFLGGLIIVMLSTHALTRFNSNKSANTTKV